DVVDTVIGWLIDVTSSSQLVEHLCDALVQLHPFWISDIQFSFMMLGQFTEDLEMFLGADMVNAEQGLGDHSVEALIKKVAALLKVYFTVMLCLGENISVLRGGPVTVEYLSEPLHKLVVSLGPMVKDGKSEAITILSNDTIRLLLHQLSAGSATSCGDLILPFVISQTNTLGPITDPVAISLLRLLQKVVEIYSTQLPVYILMHLLGPVSVLPILRFSLCPQVVTELTALYHSLLALKSVPLVEEAYRLVLGDIEGAYNTLLSEGSRPPLVLVADPAANPWSEYIYSPRQAQQAVLFNISALTEIANTKSNLIGMWALSPSIFTLLSSNLMISDTWMNQHQAMIVYTVVHAFYSHCTRHANFMSSSVLLTAPGPLDTSRMAGISQATNQNFTRIIQVLVNMLSNSSTAFDSRCLLMKWTSDILAALTSTPHVYSKPTIGGLVTAIILQGYHNEQQIFQCASHCLKTVFSGGARLPDETIKKCLELCVYRLSDSRKPVRETFLSLLKILPVDKILNLDLFEGEEEWMASDPQEREIGMTAVWHARRAHMASPPSGTFHSHNFRHIMAYILSGTQPGQTGNFHWLEAMYHARQRSGNEKGRSDSISKLSRIIDNNDSLLWFWATWECAQFAILARLRTPLGKAPETFVAIESVIKAFAVESQNFDALEENAEKRDSVRGEKAGDYICLQRVHLLMNFMENLDKLLYNAYEGCSVAMPALHKVVKTFFRTNRHTCLEWLSRIRLSLLTIAVHSGMWACAVRQGFELLRDLEDAGSTRINSPVFEQALVYLVQALCELRAPDCIVGVYNWCQEVTGQALAWILAMADKANKRYEKAAADFQSSLRFMVASYGKGKVSNTLEEDIDDSVSKETEGKENKRPKEASSHTACVATVRFVSQQVSDCYTKLGDWSSVIDWQENFTQMQQNMSLDGTQGNNSWGWLKSSMDVNFIKALSEFEVGNIEGVKQSLELIPGMSMTDCVGGAGVQRSAEGCSSGSCLPVLLPPNSWDMQREEDQLQRMFVRASTQLMEQTESLHRTDAMRCIQQAEKLGDGLLRIFSIEWPPSLPSHCLTHLASFVALHKQLDNKHNETSLIPLSSQLVPAVDDDLSVYNQLMRSINLQRRLISCDKHNELASQLSQLQLAAATVARKQQNTATAEDILLRQVSFMQGVDAPQESVLSALVGIKPEVGVGDSKLSEMLRAQREGAKLLRTLGKQRSSLDVLANSIITSCAASSSAASAWNPDLAWANLNARSLLTLVKWLQLDPKLLASVTSQMPQGGAPGGICTQETNSPSPLAMKINTLLEMESVAVMQGRATLVNPDSSIGTSPMLPETEGVVGRLLHLSTMQSSTLAKGWFSLATWCYKWGRKAVDNASNGYVELSIEEEDQVIKILPKNIKAEDRKNILSVLSHIHSMESSEEDIIEEDQSMYDDGTETTRKQLLACCSPGLLTDLCVDRLIMVWKEVVKRVYHYYRLSAKAYFTFLHVNGLSENTNNEGGNVISTLRLLRLLVKHASELREVLETGLSQTPTNPWKGIIPQLFSRLSHPESYVRQSISELLCRIALDTPHLIVYPAVVGSSSKIQVKIPGQKGFLKPFLSQGEDQLDNPDIVVRDSGDHAVLDDEDVEEGSSPELQACLATIVEALSKLNPQMIAEVQLMVQELRRVTLLWDELWLGTLNQQAADVQRRLAQLEAEVRRVQSNTSLSADMKATVIREKHLTIMKPTLYTMEHLNEITSQAAQTPQEKWFQATYGKQISAALQRLRDPPDPSSPHDTWSLFKCVHHSLQQRAQKRNSLQLKMDEISPKLAALKNSVIPMPGLTTPGKIVTIESVHNTSQILPTKTKPKKLLFIGSDGKRHPYLFKGLEDLHLDERIMQFLSIVNNMFTYHKRSNETLYPYRARHYSVTPLGPRSGLIQWVEGATALFSLYKKWQQREALAHTLKSSNSSHSQQQQQQQQQAQPTIARPSEVFFNKLTPILKEKGLDNLDNRKDWPLSVLRKVLDELMDETPDDLLAKEMWCCSSGAGEWWQMTQSYARSTAVMSMIGYIIGLGDRHLDNVLVDLATGEVVHIDYNVCFEKGKSLRVPEKVPFRMTANIETALGLTGVEGTFRVSSEHVIKTMRKGRESLLTLLEAFVYDPLVDWTTSGDGGFTGAFYGGDLGAQGGVGVAGGPEGRQSKQQMERDITSSMFAIRLTEMESAWAINKAELMSSLPQLCENVQQWLKTTGRLAECAAVTENLNTIRSILEEAQLSPHHSLHSLFDRYSDYLVLKESRDQVMASVGDRINEYSNWHKIHTLSVEKLQSPAFQAMCAELSSPLELSPPSFSAASSFLQGAGQFQIIAQCEQLETEMCSILEQRRSLLHTTVQILHTYNTLVSQFGSVCAEDNRTFKFLGWLQEILSDFTSIKCEEVMSHYHDQYNMTPTSQLGKAQIVLNIETKLKNQMSDLNSKLLKLIDRRAQETTETVVLEVQVQEMEDALKKFLQDNGLEGENSLTSVIVSALFTLNKRYLQMEVAAAAASDRLMDLTSRDGDWFLDELCSMSANVNQFLETLSSNTHTCDSPHVKSMLYSLGSTHNVYIALQELNMNFRSIILPEAIKLTQAQDSHLLSILSQLQSLTSQGLMPLDSLVSQIEIMHRNALMGMDDQKPEILMEIERLQTGYSNLLHQTSSLTTTVISTNPFGNNTNSSSSSGIGINNKPDQLTSGQMLLMGFDGLFTRLESDFAEVLDSVALLDVPIVWKKVDTVREAKSMQLSNFSSATRPLLVNLFFLKRLQTIQEFFFMATQLAAAMQGLTGGVIYDDEQMAKPVKKFIADFVRKQVLGFPSQVLAYIILLFVGHLGVNVAVEIELKEIGADWKVPLEQLCKKGLESASGAGQFQHRHLSECTTITSHLDTAWRKLDLARRLDTQVALMKGQVQRCQPQLARFQWLHEDLFTQAGRQPAQMAPPIRGSVLAELKKTVQLVLSQEPNLTACQERYMQMEASISQRLRWAAGANPSLNTVLDSFEKAASSRKNFVEEETQRATELSNLCQGVLHLEAMRTRTQEASAADTAFMQLLNQCSECSMLLESTCSSVAEIELQILSLKPLTNGEKTDAVWTKQAIEAVDEAIAKAQADMELIAQELATCQRGIHDTVTLIKGHLSTHHKLMSDIRSILKTLAKLEEQDYGEEIQPASIRGYLADYKNFSEKITLVLKMVVSEETSQQEMTQSVAELDELTAELDLVYDSLMEFAPSIFAKNVGQTVQEELNKRATDSPSRAGKDRDRDSPPLAANNSPMASASTKLPVKKDKISRDPKTGKAVQERNWYAVGVWRRVKMKLEGRDPDPNKKMTVAEQVEHVIQEAKNPDNLAVLYEGWTPWV
ncbi:serine/threonine-protein kinase smg1, partial [Plakobranchus ocellatus]